MTSASALIPRTIIAGLVVSGLISGCATTDGLPGTALGTFEVTAVLSSNTCGRGLGAKNPWKFDAELSLDGNTLYFRGDGQEDVSAPLDSENVATYTLVENQQASADGSCVVSLKTIYTVQIDEATAPQTSSGSLRFEYSSLYRNACASQLTVNGGAYDDLPCALEYSFTALKAE